MSSFTSEQDLIDFLLERVDAGLGDDCGFWPDPEDPDWLVTTDFVLEDVHFDAGYGPRDVASKLLAANLSDVAAMGGYPKFMVCSVTERADEDWLRPFLDALVDEGTKHDVPLIGGDTAFAPEPSSSLAGLTILAKPHPDGMLRRTTARPGQQLAVTGSLGGPAAAWRQPPDERSADLQRLLSEPPVRLIDGQTLVKNGVRCGIDVSDGLLMDLKRIGRSSGTGAVIDWTTIPIHPQAQQLAESTDRALTWAIGGGEDFELLCALPEEISADAYGMTVIGRVREEPGIDWKPPLPEGVLDRSSGYDHFQAAGN